LSFPGKSFAGSATSGWLGGDGGRFTHLPGSYYGRSKTHLPGTAITTNFYLLSVLIFWPLNAFPLHQDETTPYVEEAQIRN